MSRLSRFEELNAAVMKATSSSVEFAIVTQEFAGYRVTLYGPDLHDLSFDVDAAFEAATAVTKWENVLVECAVTRRSRQ